MARMNRRPANTQRTVNPEKAVGYNENYPFFIYNPPRRQSFYQGIGRPPGFRHSHLPRAQTITREWGRLWKWPRLKPVVPVTLRPVPNVGLPNYRRSRFQGRKTATVIDPREPKTNTQSVREYLEKQQRLGVK